MTPARSCEGAAARKRAQGFTLLEVIVAFALLGVALTLLLGAISGGARQVSASEGASRASLHAQSLLADVGVGDALELGQREGEFENGRYRWKLRIGEYADPAIDSAAASHASSTLLRELTLDVSWGDEAGQSMQWRTLRIVSSEDRR